VVRKRSQLALGPLVRHLNEQRLSQPIEADTRRRFNQLLGITARGMGDIRRLKLLDFSAAERYRQC
jgi:hypothetical protein